MHDVEYCGVSLSYFYTDVGLFNAGPVFCKASNIGFSNM